MAAAVAGGNLVMTIAPERPRVDGRVEIRATGQVGDLGRLLVFRTRSRGCADTARAARRTGALIRDTRMQGSFDRIIPWRPRRTGRVRLCGYLYATSCDAAGRDCGEALGLPPDAGFFQVRVRVRSASH